MATTIKQAMRANRQEDLRAKLSEGKHLQYAIESIVKVEKLQPSETSNQELAILKTAAELRLRLVNKYLPDLKNIELANDGGGELTIRVVDYSDKHKT
jgi:hypothetical protein